MLALAIGACAVLALFPLWLLVRAVKTGIWNGRGVDVVRDDRPGAFWFGVAMYGVLAAMLLSAAAYFAWDALFS